MDVSIKQLALPIKNGSTTDTAVHFQEQLSFLIVQQVVAQGQCISENIITQAAVNQVQSFAINNCCN